MLTPRMADREESEFEVLQGDREQVIANDIEQVAQQIHGEENAGEKVSVTRHEAKKRGRINGPRSTGRSGTAIKKRHTL